MIICIFFEEQVNLKKLDENYFEKDFISHRGNKYYFDDHFPNGFELGFYNWIVEESIMVGVNFEFHTINKSISNLFPNKDYPFVIRTEQGIHVLLDHAKTFWIDYEEGFIDFFLLKSEKGNKAITFALPENIAYNISPFLCKVQG